MRILYVTPLWSGLADVVVHGSATGRGMPAFFRPLQELQAEGHVVDIALGVGRQQINHLKLDSLGDSTRIYPFPWNPRGISRLSSLSGGIRHVHQLLRRDSYDFVYGHGSMGALGCFVARRFGIPTGLRLYGVNKYSEEAKSTSLLKFACLYPLEYYAFRGRKQFLLVTDDGSKGNLIHEAYAPKQEAYKFCLWRNGADFSASAKERSNGRDLVLFCPGRISPKKQQHLSIELLRELHSAGHTNVRLLLAGHACDRSYLERLKKQANDLGLGSKFEYAGIFNPLQMQEATRNSLAILSFQRVSNLSNVCIEALAAGAVVVSLDDGSLDAVIEDRKSGILVNGPVEGATRIAELIAHPEKINQIGIEAARAVRRNFLPWDQRVQNELRLIENSQSERKAA